MEFNSGFKGLNNLNDPVLNVLRNISNPLYDSIEVNKDSLNESIPHIYSLVYFCHLLYFRNLIIFATSFEDAHKIVMSI